MVRWIKARRSIWAEDLARESDNEIIFNILTRKPIVKRTLGRLKLKTELKEIDGL